MKITGTHVGIAVIIIMLLVVFGVVSVEFPGFGPSGPTYVYTAPDGVQFQNYNDYLAYMQQNFPAQTPQAPPTPTTTTHPAAQVQFSSYDFILRTAVTTATTSADFVKADTAGQFDFMTSADTVTVSSTPDTTNQYFADGDQVLVRLDCTGNPTGGLDYYDGWYYFVVHDGNPVYFLTASMLTQVSSSPYKYKVNAAGAQSTGYVVTFTSGTTNYWDIGQLYLYPRSSAANFDTYFTYQATTMASVTDGSSWVDTVGEITANGTLASTSESVYLKVIMGAANIGWGWPLYVISSDGEFQVYKSVAIMSTDMTAIGTTALYNKGWRSVSDNTLYAEKAFYKVIDRQYATKGFKHTFEIEIPVDSSAAANGTAFLFKLWLIDVQMEDNIAIGSCSTSVPTAYGFVTAYGPGAMIQASAYTASSGAGSGRILQAYLTTP